MMLLKKIEGIQVMIDHDLIKFEKDNKQLVIYDWEKKVYHFSDVSIQAYDLELIVRLVDKLVGL